MCREGKANVFITRELDRFARDIAKQHIFERESRQAGAEVEYTLYYFPDTPEGRLQKAIFASFAEFEREQTSLRTRRGIRNKVRDGNVIVHGKPPYGYKIAERNGKRTLDVYEPEAQIVRLIFTWYTVGDGENGPMSLGAIATKLTQMGVPTRTRKSNAYYRCPTSDTGSTVLSNGKECCLPHFRADQVDAAVWAWIGEKMSDSDELRRELERCQEEQETESVPLKRLNAVSDLLAENQEQLERLID